MKLKVVITEKDKKKIKELFETVHDLYVVFERKKENEKGSYIYSSPFSYHSHGSWGFYYNISDVSSSSFVSITINYNEEFYISKDKLNYIFNVNDSEVVRKSSEIGSITISLSLSSSSSQDYIRIAKIVLLSKEEINIIIIIKKK